MHCLEGGGTKVVQPDLECLGLSVTHPKWAQEVHESYERDSEARN